jgi:UDP-N-acetylmuramoylalanine--D-glutamate ligase
MTLEERIRDRKIGVLGMARSGMAAARLAMGMGGKPFVSDSGTEEKLQAQCDELKSQGIPYETGGHTDRLLGSDYLIISPGIPLKVEIVRRAQEKGIPIFSELEIASWVCPGRIAAITGANGKTTTTTLTGEILAAAGFDTCLRQYRASVCRHCLVNAAGVGRGSRGIIVPVGDGRGICPVRGGDSEPHA